MIRLTSFPCWSGQLLLSALVCVAAPMVVSGCGAETTPEVVTETGNPPFLDPDKIRVELTGTGATVSGEEGAVPPNAAVLVTNMESGESASTSADDEGAFSVTLPAQEDDEFEVQVESENQTQTLDLTAAEENTELQSTETESAGTELTTLGSEDMDPAPACEETQTQLDEQYNAIFEDIDTSCSADSDCVVANPGGECHYWGCFFAVAVSNSGQEEVATRGAALEAECDASFAAQDCVAMVPSCPGGPQSNPACVEGTCTMVMVDTSSTETPPQRGSDGPSFVTTVADIFEGKCTASCHEPNGILGGPGGVDPLVKQDLTRENSYATLTQQRSKQLPTMWLVGGGLEDSYLWHKLSSTHLSVGGQGAKMPLTGELTAEELALIQAWIEGGATP